MTECNLAVVGNNQQIAAAVQEHLSQTTGQVGFCCDLDQIREHLGRDSDGMLIVLVAEPGESKEVISLVQEIQLKELPPTVVIVEAGEVHGTNALALLDDKEVSRLRWPDDAQALETMVRQRQAPRQGFRPTDEETVEQLVSRRLLGQTPSLWPLVGPIALASSHEVPVLLSGETGTGKTYLARLIHECSPRRQHRFLVVSCGALAPELIKSEFFGHVKGAFTGASMAKEGKFAAAGEGTLFLDEIDALGLDQQASLLRVVETGEFEALGSNLTQLCRARLIVACNCNLETLVEEGRFRSDLYYRLHVLACHLPPLRDRQEDIGPLVRSMVAHFNRKYRKGLFRVSSEAIAELACRSWPGNIRQLENVVQQAVLVSSGSELLPVHLPATKKEPQGASPAPQLAPENSLAENRRAAEFTTIVGALRSCGYSRTRAALSLGISRVTLYKKMKKYGLHGKDGNAGSSNAAIVGLPA